MKQLTALTLTIMTTASYAAVMVGDGTITPDQQAHVYTVSSERKPFPTGGEWCYMKDGKPINKGFCRTEFVTDIKLPAGKRERDIEYQIIYLPTIPDVQSACKKETLVFGCTIEKQGKVVVYIYDSPTRDRVRTHELEYHVFRDIEH